MRTNISTQLSRDCEAVQIPAGTKITLPKGMKVTIAQSLGGAFTVITEEGYMVRIAGKDADAIGQEVPTSSSSSSDGEKSIDQQVFDQLRTCFDPEIPVDIVELGLVYDCKISPLGEGGHKVEIKMTLTAPGCGMGGTLSADVRSKVLGIPGVREADVQLVWDPPWNPSRMSDAAKLQLGMF